MRYRRNTSGVKIGGPGSTCCCEVATGASSASLTEENSKNLADLEAAVGGESECDALAAPNGVKVCPARLSFCKVVEANARETGKSEADTM
jgi:hypothetical protein